MVYLNTKVHWGGGGGVNEYGKCSHSSIFTSLKHLMMILKSNFFFLGFIFTPRAMKLRFFF